MNNRTILLLVAWIVFAACEKIILVDLNEANPQIVIEATISDESIPCQVLISKTGSYFGQTDIEKVSGAIVTITDQRGRVFQVPEVEPGLYQSPRPMPSAGQTYHLTVSYENQTFEASSQMNAPVKIQHINCSYQNGLGFIESGYLLSCIINDPEQHENYYRIRVVPAGTNNRDRETTYYAFSDEFFNGKQVELMLRRKLYQAGDTLQVELLCIDRPVYVYFETLSKIVGESAARSAAPGNPVSNLSNGALGYFSAYSIDSRLIIVQGSAN